MNKAPFLLLLVLSVSACGPNEPTVEETTRVISILASDEMRGRQAFSPEAWDAANYIASEFTSAGIKPLEGDTDFIQDFPLYTVSTGELTVALNGQDVDPSQVVGSVSSESISWENGGDVAPIMVGAADDLMAVWRMGRRAPATLLIVHPTHKDAFDQIAGFLRRPARTTTLGGGSNMVMVLSDVKKVDSFQVQGSAEVSESSIANVAGMLEGKRKNEIVVFSAHYDHLGIQSGAEADSIANGANDDASGTTAVIELAKYFASMGKPERTIYFVAFTAEESGGYGSRHFSEQVNPDEIVAMFNIEMIGKPAVEGPNTAWITGFDRSDFGTILQEAVEGTVFSFYADPYPDQNLFYRSDNATLARLGVPAHSISTTPIDVDPDYHQVSDEVSTLDLDHLTNTIKAIAAGAVTIVSGEKTPTRIDPQTVN
ncbi:M20/M25/M40 family metallo-hydrolase [bacterium]|nr:M20/M25/M40 family metallo-hydrolase [bacterium]